MIRSTLTRTVPRIAGSSPRGLPSSYGTWERLIASSGGRIGFQFGDIGNGFDISNGYSNGGRAFSTKVNGDEGGDTDDSDVKDASSETTSTEEEAPSDAAAESASAESAAAAAEAAKFKEEASKLKDQLLRALAEQENIRGIAKRDIEKERNFAVTKMAKSLLDVSDNLSRALEAVPEDMREDKEGNPVLASLYEGISMTETLLVKSFAANGLEKYGSPGDTFDPNLHEAMFEYPDDNYEGGQVGQVMKMGFKLNGRVIRSCQVGVVKK
ncbi:hypothetical protein TrCOL_g16 [Triparma columacea]|uniref:GrpE protein homolog n=1 Tax=Triparma columacea TaxID=722753 RepID=A0A9W7GNZ3_9STRA|nr:hypothetical protein TrCOL_g16 [Triparma columacea]